MFFENSKKIPYLFIYKYLDRKEFSIEYPFLVIVGIRQTVPDIFLLYLFLSAQLLLSARQPILSNQIS